MDTHDRTVRFALIRAIGAACVATMLVTSAAGDARTAERIVPPAAGFAVAIKPANGSRFAYFDVAAVPGHVVAVGDVLVANPGKAAMTLDVAPVVGLTDPTLGSGYAVSGRVARTPAAWLNLSTRRLTIAAGRQSGVSVSATVPAGATAGDYLAGIALTPEAGPSVLTLRRGVVLAQTERYVVGSEFTVAGRRSPGLKITSAAIGYTPAGAQLTLHMVNIGNVVLTGVQGWIRVARGARTIAAAPIAPGTFVTHSAIDYPVSLAGLKPAVGDQFSITASVSYPGGSAYIDLPTRFSKGAAAIEARYRKVRRSAYISAVVGSSISLALAALLASVLLSFGLVRGVMTEHFNRKRVAVPHDATRPQQ